MRFLRWFVYLLLLVLLAGLLYLSSLSESRAKELVSLSLPTSFYASEHNSLAKYLSSPSLRSIISLDNKTLIAVGRTGVILKSTDAGESFS